MSTLRDAAEAGGDHLALIPPLLNAITKPMLALLTHPDPRPPATDEALAAWCAAALRTGALPALRRLMAMERRGSDAPAFRVEAATAASLLALIAAEPVAASSAATSAVAGGAGNDGRPAGALPGRRPDDSLRWRDDPAVETALEILLGCVTGAPAWGTRGGPRRRGAIAGRTACTGHGCTSLRPPAQPTTRPPAMHDARPKRTAARPACVPCRIARCRRRRGELKGDVDIHGSHPLRQPGRAAAAAVSSAGHAAGRRAEGHGVPQPGSAPDGCRGG
jgi:hypothetical protein